MFRFLKLAASVAMLSTAALAGNNVGGGWSSVASWPLIPIHAVLTSDGRLLTYGSDGNGNQTGYFIYDVWDPQAGLSGGHVTLPNTTGTDIFCGAQLIVPGTTKVFLAGGDTYVNGAPTNVGNNNTVIYSGDNTLDRGNNLKRARWYATTTVMLKGSIYIQGGTSGEDRPEYRTVGGVFYLLSGVNTLSLNPNYPRNFIAPNGRIFGFDNDGQMYYVNPSGSGSIAMAGTLPGTTLWTASAAMFAPGRILQIGGSSAKAYVINITGSTPAVSATQSMSSRRQWVTATVLPNGRVLATGGSAAANQLSGVNKYAEIWNPNTGAWVKGAAGHVARLYHSIAILLPNATVLVGGGGAPGPLTNLNAEIYYPPYLYNSSGGFAIRPTITAAPAAIGIGSSFTVDVGNVSAIRRVTLLKMGSVTHSFNMEQRFIELPYSVVGGELSVQAPLRAADAPPGYYFLFVLNASGVPSVARILRVNVA